jgi:glycosyltransferase involved in cell wall biosynthesis
MEQPLPVGLSANVTLSSSAVSVIVSTYNAPAWLEKVLTGYAHQSAPGFELIVADDGSGAETQAVVARFADCPGFRLRHVWHPDAGFRKWQIVNTAIAAAAGDYLVFTDGDCVPHPDLVATHVREARPGRFLTGGCSRISMGLSERMTLEDIASGRAFSPLWLATHGFLASRIMRRVAMKALGANRPLDLRWNREKQIFNGNNASCWKADALAVGGFDTHIPYGGGDREFGYRLEHLGLRARLVRYTALSIHLDHPRSYRSDAQRAANQLIIDETLATRRVRTPSGLDAASA